MRLAATCGSKPTAPERQANTPDTPATFDQFRNGNFQIANLMTGAANTNPRSQTMIEELLTLAEKATPGRLETAERHTAEEMIECPICNGDGEVYASDYCNIDGRALGVQFYGIGPEFGAHEALWSFLMANLPAIITALSTAEKLEVAKEALRKIAEGEIDRAIWPDLAVRYERFAAQALAALEVK